MKSQPVTTPVHLTATYKFSSSDDLIDVVQNRTGCIYSRWDNPSVMAAENTLAELEGYPHALGFGSGMAAITTAILSVVQAGDTVVATRQLYGGTFEFLNDILPALGVTTVFMDCWDTEGLLAEVEKRPRLLYLESPTNPLLRIVDIAPLTNAARRLGVVTLLDATFASPINQRPVDLGVDGAVHSATKYLGGHHDITAGMICCVPTLFEKIWHLRKILGGVMDPMTAFLVQRGIQTLSLRVRCQNESALAIARHLEDHPGIAAVHYPGLTSHPDHDIAVRQMSGFGGMLSFEVAADFEGTKAVMDRLKTIKLATSLGGVTSLANQPITNTHVGLSPENRDKAGVGENLVRLSVGIEPVATLMRDLDQALEGRRPA